MRVYSKAFPRNTPPLFRRCIFPELSLYLPPEAPLTRKPYGLTVRGNADLANRIVTNQHFVRERTFPRTKTAARAGTQDDEALIPKQGMKRKWYARQQLHRLRKVTHEIKHSKMVANMPHNALCDHFWQLPILCLFSQFFAYLLNLCYSIVTWKTTKVAPKLPRKGHFSKKP